MSSFFNSLRHIKMYLLRGVLLASAIPALVKNSNADSASNRDIDESLAL
jgi:hypothetical protein